MQENQAPATQTSFLTVALAKGRLTDQTLTWLARAELPLPAGDPGRRLVLESGPSRSDTVKSDYLGGFVC